MRTVDVTERRARLARRHLLAPGHRAHDVLGVADALVALHATDPPTVVLSALVRTCAATDAPATGTCLLDPGAVDAQLHDHRRLVRVMAMRRTLWVVSTDLLPVVVAAAGQRVAGAERRRLAKEVEAAGLHADGGRWLDAACAQALEVLADGSELSAAELRDRAPLLEGSMQYGLGKSWGGTSPVAPRVLTILHAEGRITRGTNDGGWYVSRPRYVAMDRWLGTGGGDGTGRPDDAPTVEAAVAELVRRWLESFGPGTEDDIVWWLGSTKRAVRAALAELGAVEVDLDGTIGYLLPDDVDPVDAVEPWVALLPVLDPTTMGWKDREWYVGEHRSQLYDTAGNGGATIWCDGAQVGGWWQLEDGTVRTALLEDVGAEATAAIEQRAVELSEWFAGRRVLPRFPSPLASAHR